MIRSDPTDATDGLADGRADWHAASWRSRFRKRLTDWFARHARSLPWRDDPTAYKVWVSEIMCQQTQVATVVPYFKRFIARYDGVDALADADDDELMRMWEGLGYYRRARSLKQAALQIRSRHGGQFPDAFDDVIALAGIGRYTAGAILSISQNRAYPILEGNTQRVFSRVIGWRQPVSETVSREVLWQFAQAILPARATTDRSRGPAAINQAAMELGALVCTPKNPRCGDCPVARSCQAHALSLQDKIPGKVSRVDYETRTEFALLVKSQCTHSKFDRYLVRQIPDGQRFAGMWDFPRVGPEHADSVDSASDWLADGLGRDAAELTPGIRRTTIKHGVTKYRISLHVHEIDATWPENGRVPRPWFWRTLDQMAELPMSVTGRRIVRMLGKPESQMTLTRSGNHPNRTTDP